MEQNERAKFAVEILKEYANSNGVNCRGTTDLSPLEFWLISRLFDVLSTQTKETMIDLNINGYKVSVYTDMDEWMEDMHDTINYSKRVLDSLSDECQGFADIEDKEIYIFVPKHYKKMDLSLTVAHEIGHIISPSEINHVDLSKDHDEYQAMLFEGFYRDVVSIVDEIALAVKER